MNGRGERKHFSPETWVTVVASEASRPSAPASRPVHVDRAIGRLCDWGGDWRGREQQVRVR